MRVLLAPDSFTGTLSAAQAATALAQGWRATAPHDVLDLAPLSDGGPGFVAVLAAAGRGVLRLVATTDPLGRRVVAQVLVEHGSVHRTVYIESAQACGLDLVSVAERAPERASTAGLAPLLRAALDADATQVVVGLGGSATTDGGRGMWTDLSPEERDRLIALDLVAATDVDNPLLGPSGAAAVFGPQKGADPATIAKLEAALVAQVAGWDARYPGPERASGLAARPGSGAAGGLGFALYALGARRESGAAVIADAVRLPDRIMAAELVVTGEGSFDGQSLGGKVPVIVAALAAQSARPCLVLAGRVVLTSTEASTARAIGVTGWYAVTSAEASQGVGTATPAASVVSAASEPNPAAALATLAASVCREWSTRKGG